MSQVIIWALFAYAQAKLNTPEYRILPVGQPKNIGDAPYVVKVKFRVMG